MIADYFKIWGSNSSCVHVNLEWVSKEKFNTELIYGNNYFDYSKCINTLNNKKDN